MCPRQVPAQKDISAPTAERPDLLGHSKIENTVRYLGVDVEDALALAENTEI